MNKVEECRKVTNDKLVEITDYVHNCDIPVVEKKKRILELACTLFMCSVAINTEEIARFEAGKHLAILKKAVDETIDLHFNEIKPTTFDIKTDNKVYEEKNDGYRGI